MKKTILLLALLSACLYFFLPGKTVYKQIKDINQPTLKDYRSIQKYLRKGKRPELALLKDMTSRYRKFCLIGESPDEIPQAGLIHVNGGSSENCVILYSSFNKNFPGGLKRLIESISKSDYRGDILYRLGGWPNLEGGDLTLAHVPFAFKLSFFREAKKLGYKRVLWLDTSIVPFGSLNAVFEELQKKGYLTIRNGHNVGPYFNETAAKSFGISLEESQHITSCQACVIGLDFSNEKASKALELWYNAARDPNAFFSARSDQNAFSIILHQLGMQDWAPVGTLVDGKDQISSNTLFLIDRGYVQKWR